MPKPARLIILLLAVTALVAAPPALQLPSSIQLKDQFGTTHRIQFPRKQMTLLTIADEKGAPALNPWLDALKKRYGTNVHYVGIAQVQAVPHPLRSFVASRFKKKYSYPILLDWSGDTIRPFTPKPAEPNIYILSVTGTLLHKAHGSFTHAALDNFPDIPEVRSSAVGRLRSIRHMPR